MRVGLLAAVLILSWSYSAYATTVWPWATVEDLKADTAKGAVRGESEPVQCKDGLLVKTTLERKEGDAWVVVMPAKAKEVRRFAALHWIKHEETYAPEMYLRGTIKDGIHTITEEHLFDPENTPDPCGVLSE